MVTYSPLFRRAQVILTLARDNRVSDVRRAVEAGLSPVNFGNQIGQTALHIAALHGNVETVQVLIELGANANAANSRGTTPLHFAAGAKKRQAETVRALLDGGADPKIADGFGRRPYEGCEDEELRHMLGGPDPKFFKAASEGQEEQVKALLAAGGAELTSMVDAEGRAALQLAAAGGHCAVMRALLAGGAEPGMQDTSGNSALHAAAEGGSSEAVKLLLEAGATPKAQNLRINEYTSGQWLSHDSKETLTPYDQTPLHIAAEQGDTEIAELLLAAGAEVNAVDFDGKTALHIALEDNDAEMVALLLRQPGLDVNLGNADYDTPLHFLAGRGRAGLIKQLADLGADVNKPNKEGWTPLHIAARTSAVEAVRMLLQAGCDAAAPNSAGNNPLHMAAVNGRVETCRLLLERCPEAAALANHEGQTPAAITSNAEIKALLA